MIALCNRTFKEIMRDGITLFFGVIFPVVLLLLLSAIQANIPVSLFEISSLAPGICVFGLSFTTLFSALLISKDRESMFLERLYTSPLTPLDFILSYTLPMIVIALMQSALLYIVAIILRLKITLSILLAILGSAFIAILFIGIGLLFGSILTSKQVGSICGALFTNLAAWFSGIWFDLNLVGATFKTISNFLPFVHCVEIEKALLSLNFENFFLHFIVVLTYIIVVYALAVYFFLKQMKNK